MRLRHVALGLLLLLYLGPSSEVVAQSLELEGQIVCCEDCWVREDRTKVPYGTAADLRKAAECILNGDPTLLAVSDGEKGTRFFQLEDGAFKKTSKNWLDFVGKRVRVSGPVRTRKDVRFIKVDTLTVVAQAPAATEQAPRVIGAQPELVMKDLFGVPQRLSSFRGRIVVLNFWATYCLPCRKEMPDLAAIQNQYAALGVQVIGASADTLDDQKEVLQFIKETKLNFPIWLGATIGQMWAFGLGPDLPGTAIIGTDGRIVWTTRGIVNEAELRKQIDALLNEAKKQSNAELASAKTKPGDSSSVPS